MTSYSAIKEFILDIKSAAEIIVVIRNMRKNPTNYPSLSEFNPVIDQPSRFIQNLLQALSEAKEKLAKKTCEYKEAEEQKLKAESELSFYKTKVTIHGLTFLSSDEHPRMPICPYCFNSYPSSRLRHIKLTRTFVCQVCGYSYPQDYKLEYLANAAENKFIKMTPDEEQSPEAKDESTRGNSQNLV